MFENFIKVAAASETILLQMKEVRNVHDMISFVLNTAPSVVDYDANLYIATVATKMDELGFLPEHRNIVISVISDRALSSPLMKLAAEDMRQNVMSEDAKASWQECIVPR